MTNIFELGKENNFSEENFLKVKIGLSGNLIETLHFPLAYQGTGGEAAKNHIIEMSEHINILHRMYNRNKKMSRKGYIKTLSDFIIHRTFQVPIKGFDDVLDDALENIEGLTNDEMDRIMKRGEYKQKANKSQNIKAITKQDRENFKNFLMTKPEKLDVLKHCIDLIENAKDMIKIFSIGKLNEAKQTGINELNSVAKRQAGEGIKYIEENTPNREEQNRLDIFKKHYKDFLTD